VREAINQLKKDSKIEKLATKNQTRKDK